MSVISTGNHPKALWPGVFAWWGLNYNQFEKEYTALFDMKTSGKAWEELVQSTSFGLAPIKGQGAAVSYDSHQQGYTTRATHVAYALGYIVTKEEIMDNLYEEVSMSRAASLANSMNQTKETVAANVYNRAFNSSYTFGDAKELLATDHPNTSGGTFSNELATPAALSEASIEDLIIQIMGATNDRGLRLKLKPRSLIVPRQEWFNANRILQSIQQSGTANNDVNVLRMTNALPGGIKVNHYLTDANNWFIRTDIKTGGMCCFERSPIEFTKDNDFDTDNAKAKAYERYSFTVGDPRALYGSAPA